MVNLQHLGEIKSTEPLDLENYADNRKAAFQLPKHGEYTVQVKEQFDETSFSRTQKTGALSASIDPKIIGPTNEGFTMRYVKVSNTPFKRDGKTVSQAGDFLRACGYQGVISDEQELADAIADQAGRLLQVELDWRAYNGKTGLSVEGMSNFPKLANGDYQSWLEDPNDVDEKGNAKRVPARLYIRRFIPAE